MCLFAHDDDFGYFRFAIEFDYDNHVISVREGCYLTKESKGWHIPGKQYKLICVEEPFDTTRNLGNSSDMTSSKGLKEEFRRALDILYQKCNLDTVCAQYVFPPSYYNSNGYGNRNNKKSTTTTDANGVTQAQKENSYAGRRYINSYRSNNYYYDDQDYDDDDDEDEEPAPREISVMETLNIGTRPSTSKNPISGSSNESKSRESGTGGSRSAQSKEASSSSSGSKGDQSNRSQSRNRSRQKEGTTESSSSTTAKGSSRSSSSKEKSSSSGSSSSSARNRKKGSGGGGGGGGDGQKGGRSGGNSSNGSGRAARSTVEFSLAEIANVAPKLLSAAKKEQQQQQQQHQQQHQQQGSNQNSSEANGDTSGSGAGEEGSSSTGSSSKGRRKGRKNVVWSTNSNRGETTRRQGGGVKANGGVVEPAEKAKVIFVEEEQLSSDGSAPTPRPSSVVSEA